MKQIPYGRHHISEEDIKSVNEVLRSDFLTQGEKVNEFEKEFANYVGSKYSVSVANGTAALHLCALAMDVDNNSRVITSPISFVATANCVRYCGGEVFFSDIKSNDYTLDEEKVAELLSKHPKRYFQGIIPIDFAGRPANMPALRKLAEEYDCWIIEDACHAPGGSGEFNGQTWKCGDGQYAELAIFSFHPVKHIACGEGGMITTNDSALYKKLLMLRSHGITKDPNSICSDDGWYYEMQLLGYNYRLSDIHASLGLSQLRNADWGLSRRIEIARMYDRAFNSNKKIVSHSGYYPGHAYHLYIIEIENRKGLYDYLRENNVYAQIHYIPIHLQPYYRQFGWQKNDFPVSEQYYKRCLSIPMFPSLTDKEVNYIIDLVEHFLENEV
ncbi:MAG: UDP-4-amino-4,6-dideoxy-N-acetyl-beta-L-altrosamine transaminase [Ekhidna sp.]